MGRNKKKVCFRITNEKRNGLKSFKKTGPSNNRQPDPFLREPLSWYMFALFQQNLTPYDEIAYILFKGNLALGWDKQTLINIYLC